MAFVVTFEDYIPPPRYDGEPWTEVQIQEAASSTGPWATIDTQALTPPDDDPAEPTSRDITTDQATALELWYRLVFFDEEGDQAQPTFPVQNRTPPGPRDLCTLMEVTAYVPAYQSDTETTAKLRQLISAESELFISQCGREIVPVASAATIRRFDITRETAWRRWLNIGDLSTIEDATVTLLNADGTVAEVIEETAIVPLYGVSRYPTDAWEPITALSFPAYLPDSPALTARQSIEIEGVWGFPSIPLFVREATAASVVLRYLSDVAETGTDFAEAANTVNFGGLSRRRDEALAALAGFVAA